MCYDIACTKTRHIEVVMKKQKKLITALLDADVAESFKSEAKRRGMSKTGLLRVWIAKAEQRREAK